VENSATVFLLLVPRPPASDALCFPAPLGQDLPLFLRTISHIHTGGSPYCHAHAFPNVASLAAAVCATPV